MFLLSDIQYVIDFPGLGNEQQWEMQSKTMSRYLSRLKLPVRIGQAKLYIFEAWSL